MIKTFTENDLVRFLYDEMSEQESADLREAMLTDDELRQAMDQLKSVHGILEQTTYSPSTRTINKILDFSKGYQKQSV